MAETESGEVRELRLGGTTAIAAGVVLLVLLGGAFWLGRRVERSSAPADRNDPLAAIGRDEPAAGSAQPKDVDASADYFDRTAARKSAPAARPSAPEPAPSGPV